ncbi:hypothetical protein ET475_11690 [Microbacterium protaetiae]|uniref:Lipoprotein n=1 Tax=Microbacterium protaetiae TaxID=2509458 RepID=A0A4P6EFJ8_9MICO|nr:hypothetical protein [Microbacterium protaetiae]QAY60586.1 hypothetical protein ET475_11690 [Microbacterium protaetiae]
MHRRILSTLTAVLVTLGAAGCSAAPHIDLEDAWRWAEQIDQHPPAGYVATASFLSTLPGHTAEPPVVLDFAAPMQLEEFRVACYGGTDVLFGYELAGISSAHARVSCDQQPHTVSPESFATQSVRLTATSTIPTYVVVAAIGGRATSETESDSDPSADPWEGYYDDQMQNQPAPALLSFGGSFGPPDAVSVAQTTDVSMSAGHHLVQVQCDGPRSLAVTLAAIADDGDDTEVSEGEPAETTLINCPVIALLELTTTQPGLVVRLDSRGEPGGFVVRVDPKEFAPED